MARRVASPSWLLCFVVLVSCDERAAVDDGGAEDAHAGPSDARVPEDAGRDAERDAGRDAFVPDRDAGLTPGVCPEGCPAGETCCPIDGIGGACVSLGDAGACPLPDLTVSPERLTSEMSFTWELFAEDDCGLLEGCVGAPGWRRLMRFSTETPNIGTDDMHLGRPSPSNPYYQYSECFRDYRFEGYADYRLYAESGSEVARGHKRAFCLMDLARWSDEPDVAPRGTYDCGDQGIQRGWSDIYHAGLDCQWLDVTDVEPGDYTLRVSLNVLRRVAELDYDNNVVEVPVTVPGEVSMDPTAACAGASTGEYRDCGWTVAGSFACTPGAAAVARCGAACAASSCTGDPILRVCEGSAACAAREALGSDDDCGSGVYCPAASFTCPSGGEVTVLTGAYRAGGSYGCTVRVE